MQPVDKRKKELEESKRRRMEEIVDEAAAIFCEMGIDNTKMTDIAKASNVGVASVYRYFKTKADIVIQVGIKFWLEVEKEFNEIFNSEEFKNKNGIDQLKEIGDFFIKLYKDHYKFLNYLHEFDSYVVKENITKDRLKEYEESIIEIKNLVLLAITKGQEDGTIKSSLSAEELYITTSHTLLSLTQKLAIMGSVLESDCTINGERQISMVIDMVLAYIKK